MTKEEAIDKAWLEASRKHKKAYKKTYYKDHKEQMNASSRDWYKANKANTEKGNKRYYKNHRKQIQSRATAWYEANKEKSKENGKRYQETHKKQINSRVRAYRQANKEKCKAQHATWRKANPKQCRELSRQSAHKRRALKRQTMSESINEKVIYLRNGWICQHCQKKVDKRFKYPNPMSASLDHIVPLSKGGTHTYKNVQLAHWVCNVSKQANVLPQGEQLRIF